MLHDSVLQNLIMSYIEVSNPWGYPLSIPIRSIIYDIYIYIHIHICVCIWIPPLDPIYGTPVFFCELRFVLGRSTCRPSFLTASVPRGKMEARSTTEKPLRRSARGIFEQTAKKKMCHKNSKLPCLIQKK